MWSHDGTPLLQMDGYEDCIVGLVSRFGCPDVACYDIEKVIDKLMADGLSREEAVEFWHINQLSAWVGPLTPCFILLKGKDDG